jgi:hypothetical protein
MAPPSTVTTLAVEARYADFALASAAVAPIATMANAVNTAPTRTAANRRRIGLVVWGLISSPFVVSTTWLPNRVVHRSCLLQPSHPSGDW